MSVVILKKLKIDLDSITHGSNKFFASFWKPKFSQEKPESRVWNNSIRIIMEIC